MGEIKHVPCKVIDLFESPIVFKLKHGPDKFSEDRVVLYDVLCKANDAFFDTYEDCLFIQVVNGMDGHVMVHFNTMECTTERAALYRGWIYGYLQGAKLEYWET